MLKSICLSQYVCGMARRQQGAVLVVALIFLLVMTLIGVTAMQGTSQQEKMASNTRQRNLAFQGAEACIRTGETGLQAATLPNFNNSTPGLSQPVILTTDIATFWMDTYCWIVGAGCATALSQQCPTQAELSERARYVIEELPRATLPGQSAKYAPLSDVGFYRVTARSFGGMTDAVVILQTVYRR